MRFKTCLCMTYQKTFDANKKNSKHAYRSSHEDSNIKKYECMRDQAI